LIIYKLYNYSRWTMKQVLSVIHCYLTMKLLSVSTLFFVSVGDKKTKNSLCERLYSMCFLYLCETFSDNTVMLVLKDFAEKTLYKLD